MMHLTNIQAMRFSALTSCVSSLGVLAAFSAALGAQVVETVEQPAEVGKPIVVDQETFAAQFSFGGTADVIQSFDRNVADSELRLRELAADKSVTEDQLDRIRMANYSEKAKVARVRLDARRAVVGKEFTDMNAAFAAYQSYVSSQMPQHFLGNQKPSVASVVYNRVLTDQQKKNHLLYRAERRDRLARASIIHRVSLLNRQIPMTVEQSVALAKLVSREMPPAGFYDDEQVGLVIDYALSVVSLNDLEPVFDEVQLKMLKPHLETGIHIREELRRLGVLERITAYRAAQEKAVKADAESENE